jgi:hypothetical protein
VTATADLAPSTLARRQATLRSFFGWAFRNDVVAADPTGKLEPIKVPQWDPRPLMEAQVEAILAVIPIAEKRNRLFFILLYETGMRVGEALVPAPSSDDKPRRGLRPSWAFSCAPASAASFAVESPARSVQKERGTKCLALPDLVGRFDDPDNAPALDQMLHSAGWAGEIDPMVQGGGVIVLGRSRESGELFQLSSHLAPQLPLQTVLAATTQAPDGSTLSRSLSILVKPYD